MTQITNRISRLRQRICQAAEASGRDPAQISLVAVSKTRNVDELRAAHGAGIGRFGENYLQEALPKIALLSDLELDWHFIGPVQSNKTREVAAHFDWVQSVDRIKVARRLNQHRSAWSQPLNICIQVNLSAEPQKAGVVPDKTLALCREIAQLPRLTLRGLMFIPAPTSSPGEQLRVFSRAHELYESLRDAGLALDTLSMGMSADMDAAIRAGSTMIRIGTDIFGPRN